MSKNAVSGPIPAVILARVSSEEQVLGYSLDGQVAECTERAHKQGYGLIGVYRDEGISGTIIGRPALRSALQALPDGGVLLVWRQDRLARDVVALGHLLEDELAPRSIRLDTPQGEIDYETADGRLRLNILGSVGQWEVEANSERTRRGKVLAAQAGRPGSRAPYGYRLRRKATGESYWEIDQATAPVVRQIYRWTLRGESSLSITQRLNREGVRPPESAREWGHGTIDYIIRNPIYLGMIARRHQRMLREQRRPHQPKYVWRRLPRERWQLYPGQHPAIMEPAVWERVQERLAPHRRRPRTWRTYLLSGLLRCPRCGGSMTGMTDRRWDRYRCTRYTNSRGCVGFSVSARRVEAAVYRALEVLLGGQPDELVRVVEPEENRDFEDTRRTRRQEIQAARRTLVAAIEAGEWTAASLGLIRDRLAELENQADTLARMPEPEPPSKPPIGDRVRPLWQVLTSSDTPIEARREALLALFTEIVWDGERLHLTFRTQ